MTATLTAPRPLSGTAPVAAPSATASDAPRDCPLTPALRALLEASLSLGTTNNKILARHLFLHEESVKSNFRRIALLLDTHSRSEAILRALVYGWISLPGGLGLPQENALAWK